MKSVPWVDWLPGVLGQDQMVALAQAGHILPFESDDMDYSSFDLHLSSDVYEITGGAIKPNGQTYMNVIRPFISRVDPERASHPGTFVLQPRKTYVVQLKEQLVNLGNSSIYGQATAKSSVGRVDVLARLVVDGMRGYEEFIPQHLGRGSGHLYLEITSMTFPVRIKEGTKLSQLRLFYGRPANSEIRGAELLRTVLRPDGGVGWSPEEANSECYLSVNLDNDNVCGVSAAAFNASDAQGGEPINLWTTEPKTGRPDPCRFWKLLSANRQKRLALKQNEFYILRSKERLALPAGVAAYCRAIDETIGEMRIHYAGFVHPFFGRDRKDGTVGTPLIFEVRGHDVEVSLADAEIMAKLLFYRMSKDAVKGQPSPYDDQELKLSAFFRDWPEKLKQNVDGSVQAA